MILKSNDAIQQKKFLKATSQKKKRKVEKLLLITCEKFIIS